MSNCEWSIPCTKQKRQGSKFCDNHSRAMGEKINKAPKPYTIPKQSEKKKKQLKEQKSIRDSLSLFYLKMIGEAPTDCMECGYSLKPSMLINPRSIVAHILPKRQFKSISEERDNVVYLCIDCHGRMDNFSPEGMKIFPLLKERVTLLQTRIKPDEVRFIPECFNIP